jgi:predicted heme/steroid binding protein
MHYWPIIESDQSRADVFLDEYRKFSADDKVPNLMILTLTNDHGSGLDPNFPTIASMGADNDLAFGRVVDAVSHSPQWKDTCIFMIEDDGQALPDHVDGHRTAMEVVSPYVRRKIVDSTFYTTVSLLRSIELMLGLDPMNQFDANTPPITGCFQDIPDLTPYEHCANKRPLDERNTAYAQLDLQGKRLYVLSKSLNWQHMDLANPAALSRIHWYSLTQGSPYPEQYAVGAGSDDQDHDND